MAGIEDELAGDALDQQTVDPGDAQTQEVLAERSVLDGEFQGIDRGRAVSGGHLPVAEQQGDALLGEHLQAYWLIPARTATGDIEWPRTPAGDPEAVPPHGVEHHFAPLALVGNGEPKELRKKIPPLAVPLPL